MARLCNVVGTAVPTGYTVNREIGCFLSSGVVAAQAPRASCLCAEGTIGADSSRCRCLVFSFSRRFISADAGFDPLYLSNYLDQDYAAQGELKSTLCFSCGEPGIVLALK